MWRQFINFLRTLFSTTPANAANHALDRSDSVNRNGTADSTGFRTTAIRNSSQGNRVQTNTNNRRHVNFQLPPSTPTPQPPRVRRRKAILTLARGFEEHGWRQEGRYYVGVYQAGRQRWQGRAEKPPRHNHGDTFDMYVLNPPPAARNHVCWHAAGGGWYWIHWHNAPRDLLSAIKFVENELNRMSRN